MENNLAQNIKRLCHNFELTQYDFGFLAAKNTSGPSVSSWINGVTTPPLEKLISICKYFDITLDDLVFGNLVYYPHVKRLKIKLSDLKDNSSENSSAPNNVHDKDLPHIVLKQIAAIINKHYNQ